MKGLAALIILLSVHFPLLSAEANAILRKTTTFAVGGIGVAGTMSEGERALREVLGHSDAVTRLESALPEASPAGQLYALLGLRTGDREAYKRAFAKYGQRHATVETMSGCIVQRESFRDVAKKVDHGEYDSILTRPWPDPVR